MKSVAVTALMASVATPALAGLIPGSEKTLRFVSTDGVEPPAPPPPPAPEPTGSCSFTLPVEDVALTPNHKEDIFATRMLAENVDFAVTGTRISQIKIAIDPNIERANADGVAGEDLVLSQYNLTMLQSPLGQWRTPKNQFANAATLELTDGEQTLSGDVFRLQWFDFYVPDEHYVWNDTYTATLTFSCYSD